MPGGLTAPVSRTVHLEPRDGSARPRRRRLGESPSPAVVVEVVGGQAVVAHELAANGDIATEPCARGASSDWYFANGTTLKGAQQYLVLFDPFGDDAIVDVTFLTDDGVQEPDDLQALSVPRRSRVTIPVTTSCRASATVAVHVHARSGRVVAERSQLFDGTASDGEVVRQGVALSLGAAVAAPRVVLPVRHHGRRRHRRRSGIANFGATSTTVEVNVMPRRRPDARARSRCEIPATWRHHRRRRHARPGRSREYAVTVTARDAEGRSAPVVAEAARVVAGGRRRAPESATALGSTRLAHAGG